MPSARKLYKNSVVLPVTCVGRIAGQYAKPRSNPVETLADVTTVLAFRGHNINGPGLDQRTPVPDRLLRGYFHSAATLNTISVFGSQSDPIETTSHVGKGPITKPTSYPRTILTSHEALLLPYETSVTRGRHCTSATFLWVGERTRQLDGAHVEFLRGLRNPIGIKLSSKTSPNELVALLNRLCPDKTGETGRITLITRLGALNVQAALPPLIKAVQSSGHQPVWMGDPCHGNTFTTADGKIKTRCAMTMLEEAQQTYAIHRRSGSRLGGLHIEQTGESVTECVEHIASGSGHLSLNYRTLCDPRLSREQAMLFVARFANYAQRLDLKTETHKIFEQRFKKLRSEKEMVDDLAIMDMPFVEDHPQELAAFAYQPPLIAGMARS